MGIQVPTRGNTPLAKVLDRINDNEELRQPWKCANINAVDRCGISDHGEIHIRIVANAALKLLRFLVEAGLEPNMVKNHGMTVRDAEVIVVLAACLHDLGVSIHRDDHERYSLFLAYPKARELLDGIYAEHVPVSGHIFVLAKLGAFAHQPVRPEKGLDTKGLGQTLLSR